MRSHMMNLQVSKQEEESSRTIQLSFEAESAPSSSSSSEGEEDDKGLSYGLRENPKRSIRLVDPEFSFAAPENGSSILLQDRESETESSKNNPTRARSKRAWKIGDSDHKNREAVMKKVVKFCETSKTESWVVDHEPVSSVSDATTEEDVAFCLMMLSRDKWKRQKKDQKMMDDQYEDEDEEQEEDQDDEEDEEAERSMEDSEEESQELMKISKNKARKGRYKCETCNKVFRSYQALGGHRASHKKMKMNSKMDHQNQQSQFEGGNCGTSFVVEKKIHECPVCFRVFASGQALGGHKRTHVTGSSMTMTIPQAPCSSKVGSSFIDLNLPAPIDDDDLSQIENSAVSDAEFVKLKAKPIRH